MIFFVIISILALDQATKLFADNNLALGQSLPVIKGIFHITVVYNRGAAFGIFQNQLPLFIISAVLFLFIFYLEIRKKKDLAYMLSLGLILAGALGNLIDRLRFGYVIDFLDFRVWPVFNIADSAITVGAVLLGWSILTTKRKKKVSV